MTYSFEKCFTCGETLTGDLGPGKRNWHEGYLCEYCYEQEMNLRARELQPQHVISFDRKTFHVGVRCGLCEYVYATYPLEVRNVSNTVETCLTAGYAFLSLHLSEDHGMDEDAVHNERVLLLDEQTILNGTDE